MAAISHVVQDVQQILTTEPTSENFRHLVSTLSLKNESIPNYMESYEQQVLAYLCHFVPYS